MVDSHDNKDRSPQNLTWCMTDALISSDCVGFIADIIVPSMLPAEFQSHGLVWRVQEQHKLPEWSVRVRQPLAAETWDLLAQQLGLIGAHSKASTNGLAAVQAVILHFAPGERTETPFI